MALDEPDPGNIAIEKVDRLVGGLVDGWVVGWGGENKAIINTDTIHIFWKSNNEVLI